MTGRDGQRGLETMTTASLARATTPAELRRVAFATVIGTTVEWYDFFL